MRGTKEKPRRIAAVVVISSDDKILMGQKDPKVGGTYSQAGEWHIPGGGVDADELLLNAAMRELKEETGLVVVPEKFDFIDDEIGEGQSPKVDTETGEEYIDYMQFYRFEVRLDETAAEVQERLREGELKNLTFFSPSELAEVNQIPSGREFFERRGYLRQETKPPTEFKVS